jgi:hypothetical protein
MAFASNSSKRVGRPRRRASNPGRSVLKIFAATVVVVALLFATTTAIIAGMGRLLAVTLEARSDTQTIAALTPPSVRFAWAALPAEGMANRATIVASLTALQTAVLPDPPVVASIATVALASPNTADTPDDPIFTGSLALYSPKLDTPDVKATGRSEIPSAVDTSMPLPRARPRLASLTPFSDLGIKPDEDTRPPKTAIYDITAQVVYLPNGERLEAHSGLGSFMDNPRHVHLRMRGATPPNTYKLTLRESLFHGVRAIRLTPVNEGEMFGRAGILAHTYMLGPSGQSNGCISFKDYQKFLHAYLRGEVDRIVVVSRLAKPPAFYARNNSQNASAL